MVSASNGEGEAVVFDREAALAALDGDLELLAELAELFLSDAPGMVEEIRSAVGDGDCAGLRCSAHTLKGSASNFRAEATVQAAFRLECMGREEELDGVEQALEQLLHAFARLTPELEKLAQG